MKSSKILAAMVCLVSLAAIAAACSSDDDDSGGSSSTTTKERRPPARVPTVSEPVTEGKGIQALATDYDLASLGYERVEYFFEGDAVGYEASGSFESDGEWAVEESEAKPYRSRMVVIRPADPADFSGTVYVEWFNVTGGVDAGATWINGHNQMMRSGAVWVGVTAQAVGVNGGGTAVESSEVSIPQGGLVASDSDRYGTLQHPGDLYAYDIFTQAGTAARGEGDGVQPLEGLEVTHLLAVGESQSAGRLTTYVNAVEPMAGQFDGFLIYSRGSGAAPLGDRLPDEPDPNIPEIVRIRTDLDVPVFEYETEYDVDVGQFADARQDDTEMIRVWEVAGQSHQDDYAAGGYALSDLGDGAAEAGILDPAQADGGLLNCDKPLNAGGMYASLQAALSHLEAWAIEGTEPPNFDTLDTTGSGDGIELARDEHGNATGGVRTPIVEVPLAANIGDDTNTPGFCRVFGQSRPFDAATVANLYPGGSEDYVAAFNTAVDQALDSGVWLQPEADNFRHAAENIKFE